MHRSFAGMRTIRLKETIFKGLKLHVFNVLHVTLPPPLPWQRKYHVRTGIGSPEFEVGGTNERIRRNVSSAEIGDSPELRRCGEECHVIYLYFHLKSTSVNMRKWNHLRIVHPVDTLPVFVGDLCNASVISDFRRISRDS